MRTDRDSAGTGSISPAIRTAAQAIAKAHHISVFTGAGISVESGIPPFRGKNGIWNAYNPRTLELEYFRRNPGDSWPVIREIFYDFFGKAQPNDAHRILARWERDGLVRSIVTQNIDDLHSRAGSVNIIEYHGNSRHLRCLSCNTMFDAVPGLLANLPPLCTCGGILKPDFVFFGEAIPQAAAISAEREMKQADLLLVIGSTGEVYPAAALPEIAKQNGAFVIELNPSPSNFTRTITDIHIAECAVRGMRLLDAVLGENRPGR